MSDTQASAPVRRPLGLHMYLYCWIAILLIAAFLFVFAGVLVINPTTPHSAIFGILLTPTLYLLALWLSLKRCGSEDLSGSRGLILMTAYMTVGIGGFSMLIAVPATMAAIMGSMSIALTSLVSSDAAFAPRHFRRMVFAFYRHRMYQ